MSLFFTDPATVYVVDLEPTSTSVTATFSPVEGIVDFYNVSITDPTNLNSVLAYQIAAPTGKNI